MLQAETELEIKDYQEQIAASKLHIRELWMVQFNIATFTCPAVMVASRNDEGYKVANIHVRCGESAEGDLQPFQFIYTACPYSQKFKAGQGQGCCPEHVGDYEDLMLNHVQLGQEYDRVCSTQVDKEEFFDIYNEVRSAFIMSEGQQHFTGLVQKRMEKKRLTYLMPAPPPPARSGLTDQQKNAILQQRKRKAETASRSEASKLRALLTAGDIPGEGEVDKPQPQPQPPAGHVPDTGAVPVDAGSDSEPQTKKTEKSKKSSSKKSSGMREIRNLM